MKTLIINADDLGWSEPVTAGILQAHCGGVVTRTTLMTNLPGSAEALARARREAPRLAVGVHLNLTEGEPLSPRGDVAPIVERLGRLRRSVAFLFRRAWLSRAAREAIGRELEAQVARARDLGLSPTHLDSHKHVHLHPAILPLAIADPFRVYETHSSRADALAVEHALRPGDAWLVYPSIPFAFAWTAWPRPVPFVAHLDDLVAAVNQPTRTVVFSRNADVLAQLRGRLRWPIGVLRESNKGIVFATRPGSY